MLHVPAALDSMDPFHEGVAIRSQRAFFSAVAVEMDDPDRLCLERGAEFAPSVETSPAIC